MQSDSEIQIRVKESYPLCPRYIQRRAVRAMEGDSSPIDSFSCGTIIDQPARETISRADTMFLSTSYPKDCIDVSHRGGNRGFIEVIDEQTLRIPDFNGNSMFNSFGNLQQNSNAGTIIIDFASGYAFQAIGKSAVLLDQEDPDNRTGGTGRFSLFKIERWQRYCLPAVELEFFDYSPHIPKRRSQEE